MEDSAKENLAGLIEHVASIELQIGELSAALMALRLTLLAEMGPDFERRYAAYYAGPAPQQALRAAAAACQRLLEIVQKLRGQA